MKRALLALSLLGVTGCYLPPEPAYQPPPPQPAYAPAPQQPPPAYAPAPQQPPGPVYAPAGGPPPGPVYAPAGGPPPGPVYAPAGGPPPGPVYAPAGGPPQPAAPSMTVDVQPSSGRPGTELHVYLRPFQHGATIYFNGRALPKRLSPSQDAWIIYIPGSATSGYVEVDWGGQRFRSGYITVTR